MPSSITTVDLRVSVRNVQTWRKEGNRPADLLAPSVASGTLLQNHSASRSKSSKSRVLGIVLIASCPAVFENSIGFSVRWTCLSRPLLLLVNGAFRILSWVRRGPISEFPMPVWKAHQKRTPFPRDRQGGVGENGIGGTKSARDTCIASRSYQYLISLISHRPRKGRTTVQSCRALPSAPEC